MKRRKKKDLSKIFMIIFFLILLFMSYNLLAKRNKLIYIDHRDVSYVELIRFKNNTMTTIKDKSKIKSILAKLNRISGTEEAIDKSKIENIDFINIYDKSFKKTEVARWSNYIKIDNKFYRMSNSSTNKIEKIFEKFNRSM